VRLEADLATALDPARLFRLALGADPDPWQARLLRSRSRRVLLNCHRQAGKSTTTGVLAAHTAIYDPGALVLLLSPSLRQSQELFRKTMDVLGAIEGGAQIGAESALRAELANGSRVVSLPGKEATVRGFSAVKLLVIDEAARVPDELYHAVRPMLATSGGRLVGLSTPWGQRGWFYEEWTHGGEGWERFRVPISEARRIPADFIEEERRTLVPWIFRQEYECSFEANESALFSIEMIDEAFDPEIKPLWGRRDDAGHGLFVRSGPWAE
jgi:hypothetical protein